MTIEPIEDLAAIRRFVLPYLDAMADDYTEPEQAYMAQPGLYLAAMDEAGIQGVALFVPHTWTRWEVHLAMKIRGKAAVAAVLAMFAWLFENQPRCQRIIAAIPAYNRPALIFASWLGMERTGRDKAAFARAGKLRDLILFGISKPR